jgi:hypothetical protein
MWKLIKSHDNRRLVRARNERLKCINGRTWTRRCQWLELSDTSDIKLKFEWDNHYHEVLVPRAFAQEVWERWQMGHTLEDACSIFTSNIPKTLRSRRQARIDQSKEEAGS